MTWKDVILDFDFEIDQSSKYESNPIFYDRESGNRIKIYYYSNDNKSIYYHSYESDDKYDFIPNETIYHISEVLFHQKFASKEELRDIKLKLIIE